MRLLRRMATPLILVVLAVGGYFAYAGVARRPPRIDVGTAVTEDVVRLLAVTGRLRARLANTVQPLVTGTILSLARDEGDAVRRGEVLARLDGQVTQAGIDQASAQLAARRVDLGQQEREYERLRRLVEAGGIPEQEAERAKFSLDASRESLRQLEALVAETTSRLRDYTLRSPIDGIVLSRPVDPGQNVTPQTVLYELATGSGAEIEVEIDEQYLGELREGMRATVSPLTGERARYPASVTYIGGRVSEASGAVPVRLAFDTVTPRLPVGLSVDVNLEVARHPGAITVPREAVAGIGAAPFVMQVRNDTIVRRDVRVIDWPSERIVVLQGLEPRAVLALSPRMVRAGQAVRTRKAGDAI